MRKMQQNETYSKNSSKFSIVYCLLFELTKISFGFQKYDDGNSHTNDGHVSCTSFILWLDTNGDLKS